MDRDATVLPRRTRSLLATLLFLIACLLGLGALRLGFDREAQFPGTCVFAIANGLWCTAYKLSGAASSRAARFGLTVLGLWLLNLTGELLVDFHHCVSDPFFWTTAALLLVVICAFGLSDVRSQQSRTTSTPE
jgi:hypothetical protein